MTAVNFGALVAGAVTVVSGQAWYCDGTRWIPASMSSPSVDYIAKYVCNGGEASVTFDGLPQTFSILDIDFIGRDTASGSTDLGLFMQCNGDNTAANYTGTEVFTSYNGASTASQGISATTSGNRVGSCPGVSGNANALANGRIQLQGYASSTLYKPFASLFHEWTNEAGAARRVQMLAGTWKSTAPITKLVFFPSGTAFAQGTTIVVSGRGRISISGSGGAVVNIGSSSPSNALAGQLWWKSDEGNLKVRYGTSWVDACSAASGLVLLEQHAASASATLDFTTCISSVFDVYLLEIIDLIPASAGQTLQFQVSVDGGATWDTTSGHYGWASLEHATPGSGVSGSNSTTAIGLMRNLATTANWSHSGMYRLFNPGGTASYKRVNGQASVLTGATNVEGQLITGVFLQTSAYNAFRLSMSSGNITSGTARVYGVTK